MATREEDLPEADRRRYAMAITGAVINAAAEQLEKMSAEVDPDSPRLVARWDDLPEGMQEMLATALNTPLLHIAALLDDVRNLPDDEPEGDPRD